MENFYLGISLGFNSSACIFSNERGLIAAISQERLNGEKNTKELPFDAIAKCIEIANVKEIERIAISHYEEISDEYFQKYGARFTLKGIGWENYLLNFVASCGVKVVDMNILEVDHHMAHAYSTFGFYGMPRQDEYMITSDGFGHGKSAMIAIGGHVVSSVALRNSIALVYQFVTGALGFKEHQHEGKITGLAAFGKPIYLEEFEGLYSINRCFENCLGFNLWNYDLTAEEYEACKKSHIQDFADFLRLKKAVYGLVNDLIKMDAKREDIAASVQEFAEKYTIAWIRKHCVSGHDAYIAGGLFANVKINQRIKDMKDSDGKPFFKNVYVCPAMGDEGTAVGAALLAAENDGVDIASINVQPSKKVICGSDVCATDVWAHDIDESKYSVKILDDSVDYISHALAQNKIVCLVRGEMEFGPRALCHRSILYNADSRETNDWLNKKLSRTEFMPFAPVTREEVADDLFINLDGGRDSAKFMTMTFDCTPEFAENYKAACHIDNTARPQIVSKDDDPYMWEILKKYQELTGKKAMINTSFNLHNNPIIESVDVAIKSWITSDTDVLVIENVVIEKR